MLNTINTALSTNNNKYRSFLVLCYISQIAMGEPYSESLRTNSQSVQILNNIGWNLMCFQPIQSFDILGWGSTPQGVLGVLSKMTNTITTTIHVRTHASINMCQCHQTCINFVLTSFISNHVV
jgi:hypothetical protein